MKSVYELNEWCKKNDKHIVVNKGKLCGFKDSYI